jgi:FMN-dependent NADH-azoreductase
VARNLSLEELTVAQKAALERSDGLIKELFEADTIIIAAGMINFGIPSSLKAYIDHIVRPGITFRYSAEGVEGLVKGKKAFLVLARGGIYSHGPMQQYNFQEPYLRACLKFIGVEDVEVITMEGIARGGETAANSLANALNEVSAIAAR